MIAFLPGASIVLSSEIRAVDLACPRTWNGDGQPWLPQLRQMNRAVSTPRGPHPLAVWAAVAGLSIALSAFAPRNAQACSCVDPEHWGFIGPENGRLPANAAGVVWFKPRVFDRRYELQQPPSGRRVAARIRVEQRVQNRFVRVPATARSVDGFRGIFVVAPREGLAVAATYRFTDRGSTLHDDHPEWADSRRFLGNGPHRQVQVTVDADPLPANSSLALKAGPAAAELISVASGGGMCSVRGQPVPHVSIEAGLAPEVREWRGQLLFRTLVDDEPWAGAESLCSLYPSGRSWRQIATDKVYSTCQDLDARGEAPIAFREPRGRFRELAPTKHSVKMKAFLPGTDIVLESEALTVDLSCPRAAVATWIDAAWFGMGASHQLCECPGPLYTTGFIGPADVRLPANAAGVLWLQATEWQSAESDRPDPQEVVRSRISVRMLGKQGEGVALATIAKAVPDTSGVFVVAPEGGFVPGARYFFVDREHNGEWWRPGNDPWDLRKGVIATIDNLELSVETTLTLHSTPTIVGTLRIASTFRCGNVERLPHVQIEARLGGNGQRWRNQLLYRTFVDGEGWYGASSTCAGELHVLGAAGATVGHDVLYGRCPGEKSPEDVYYWFPPLEPAAHQVKMQAFLPGTDIVLETKTVTVDLSCPATDE